MMIQKKFYFLRHSESLWNAKNLCQGQKDIELSKKGIEEAEAFAKKFTNFPINHICTSPLKRALRTAEIVQHHHPRAALSILPELMERNWGYLEGVSSERMYEVEVLEETVSSYPLHPSIESRQSLEMRAKQAVEMAFKLDAQPLLVSHGRLFVSLCDAFHMPCPKQIKNLSLLEITQKEDRWQAEEIFI